MYRSMRQVQLVLSGVFSPYLLGRERAQEFGLVLLEREL